MKSIINLFNSQRKKSTRNSCQNNYRYKSKDGKAILYKVESQNIATVCTYRIIHEDGQGTLIFELNNLYKLKNELQKKIINTGEKGLLDRAEYLLKKYNNINTELYTHRIHIFQVKATRTTCWIIDAKLQNDNNKYNEKNSQRIVLSMLQGLTNKSYNSQKYEDRLEIMLKEPWNEHLQFYENQYYLHNRKFILQIIPKVVYCRYKTQNNNMNKIKNTLERSLNLVFNSND